MSSLEESIRESSVPPDSWDCHVHVLDPAQYPYRVDRTYTPAEADLDSLITTSPFQRFLIVQASVEDGPASLLGLLKEGQSRYPNRILRGSVITSTKPGEDATHFDKSYADKLHAAGVRCLRIQGGYGSFGTDAEQLQDYIRRLAQSYCVTSLKWAISIQQSLDVWAGLRPLLCDSEDLRMVNFVAEHNASTTPADFNTENFKAFLEMLKDARVYVKISALHRRSPENIHMMKPIVQTLARAAPDRLLWGSDWPHVNPAVKGLTPTAPLAIDSGAELQTIQSWLSEEQWRKILVDNPARLFA